MILLNYKRFLLASILFGIGVIHACEMREAARIGDLSYWRSAILDNPFIVCSQDEAGMIPLHWAIYWGRKNLAQLLTKAGSNINSVDGDGNTPLHFAIAADHSDIAVDLLESHACPDIINRQGLTPIHIAILRKNIPMLKILLQHGAHVTIPDAYGATPLHLASFLGYQEAAELLLGAGALVTAVDSDGNMPVDIAQKNQNMHLMPLFSNKYEEELTRLRNVIDTTVIVYNLNIPIEKMWVVQFNGILQLGQPKNLQEKAIWEINIKKGTGPYIFSLVSGNILYQWFIRTFEWPNGDQLMLEQRIKNDEFQLLLTQSDECSENDIKQIQPALHGINNYKQKYYSAIIPLKNVIFMS
jgi:hypothetical protein